MIEKKLEHMKILKLTNIQHTIKKMRNTYGKQLEE